MSAVGKQSFFLFVVACNVALAAEGRITPWILADAALSAAFVPAAQWLGFVVAWRWRIRSSQEDAFTPAFSRFLDGNSSWLWWLCAIAVVVALVPPRSLGPWVIFIETGALIPFSLGVFADIYWLRAERGRSLHQARVDVLLQRAVSWGCGIAWFFGIAIWYGLEDRIAVWLRS